MESWNLGHSIPSKFPTPPPHSRGHLSRFDEKGESSAALKEGVVMIRGEF